MHGRLMLRGAATRAAMAVLRAADTIQPVLRAVVIGRRAPPAVAWLIAAHRLIPVCRHTPVCQLQAAAAAITTMVLPAAAATTTTMAHRAAVVVTGLRAALRAAGTNR